MTRKEPSATGPATDTSWSANRERRAANRERRAATRQARVGAHLADADASTSGWVPDPTGRHEIRFVKNGQWTSLVMTSGVGGSDDTLAGSSDFRWCPNTHPVTRAGNTEWLAAGRYIFRSQSSTMRRKAPSTRCSPVWTSGRIAFLVDSNSQTFTRVDTKLTYWWNQRQEWDGMRLFAGDHDFLGTTPGTMIRSFRDNNRHVLASRKFNPLALFDVDWAPTPFMSTTGERIAEMYSVPNQHLQYKSGDDTFVLSLLRPIAAPLSLLILTYGLSKSPHLQQDTTGGAS